MTALLEGELSELDLRLDAFEAAYQRNGSVDVESFLPPPDDPSYSDVLVELIRVDLEYGWSAGRPTTIDQYVARFPALKADAVALKAVQFEDYRQQNLAQGKSGSSALEDLEFDDFGLATAQVFIAPVEASDGHNGNAVTMLRTDQGLEAGGPRLSEVGETFLGFTLEAELGRGAFGRVYLARQGRLAQRYVALKVSADMFHEPQTLAQLQHTNIVPIYSVDQTGPLQAVCMPYFGGITFEHVLRDLRGLADLPASGHHFVSTIQDRHGSTRSGPSSAGDSAPSMPVQALSAVGLDDVALPLVAGGTTTALATLDHASFVEAVLWLGSRLAAGLAHAHERGIVHRDLKPANVLLTDDGQPMLLDFNLAQNRTHLGNARGRMGGTLPYMSPEQLRAFRGETDHVIDGRTDIYSLGLILFELTTGLKAFPSRAGKTREVIDKMLVDRADAPPRLRRHNRRISPAAEAIIRRCLEPDPAARYQSAREFQEDVECHLANMPLRFTPEPSWQERTQKWVRRHPRLTSSTGVAIIAATMLAVVGAAAYGWKERFETARAYDQWRDFLTDSDRLMPGLVHAPDAASDSPARRAEFLRTACQPAEAYGVKENAAWLNDVSVSRLATADRNRLQERMGEYLLLVAQATADQSGNDPTRLREALVYNERAGDCFDAQSRPGLWARQRQILLASLGDEAEARLVAAAAVNSSPRTAQEHYLSGLDLYREGRYSDAVAALQKAVAADPQHFRSHFLLGNSYYRLQDNAKAAGCYSSCISLNPQHAKARFNHGKVLSLAKHFGPAFEEFSRALALDPELAEAQIERAQAAAQLGRLREAHDDLTAVLQSTDVPTYVYFRRATVRERLKDPAGAAADRAEGMRREPADEVSWVTRGLNRLSKDPQGALADFRKAEELNPRSFFALQNQAHVLSEHLKCEAEALAVCDRLVGLYPQSNQARAGRAILLARAGRADDAVRDAELCLKANPTAWIRYQLAGVFAHTHDRPGHLDRAMRLLSGALVDGAGWKDLASDADLKPLQAHGGFRQLQAAAKTIQATAR